jgi:hypothetical protein
MDEAQTQRYHEIEAWLRLLHADLSEYEVALVVSARVHDPDTLRDLNSLTPEERAFVNGVRRNEEPPQAHPLPAQRTRVPQLLLRRRPRD